MKASNEVWERLAKLHYKNSDQYGVLSSIAYGITALGYPVMPDLLMKLCGVSISDVEKGLSVEKVKILIDSFLSYSKSPLKSEVFWPKDVAILRAIILDSFQCQKDVLIFGMRHQNLDQIHYYLFGNYFSYSDEVLIFKMVQGGVEQTWNISITKLFERIICSPLHAVLRIVDYG